LISCAYARASAAVASENGAMPPIVWQPTHLLSKIGATFAYVTVWPPLTVEARARQAATGASTARSRRIGKDTSPSRGDCNTRFVSLFRPARTVTSPSGDYWELYVSKTVAPAWRERRSNLSDPLPIGPLALLELPLVVLGFLWSSLVVPLARCLAVLPLSVVRGRRSRAIRIEAVNNFPHREVLLWTTTDDQVESVLNEIAAGLAEGRVVQPVGAVYSGAEHS